MLVGTAMPSEEVLQTSTEQAHVKTAAVELRAWVPAAEAAAALAQAGAVVVGGAVEAGAGDGDDKIRLLRRNVRAVDKVAVTKHVRLAVN